MEVAEAVRNSPILRWPRFLLNVSPQNAFVIRFGVVVTASIWIGKAPGLLENSATWIVITCLMLIQPTSGGSLLKGLLRGAGTIVGALSAIVLFGLAVWLISRGGSKPATTVQTYPPASGYGTQAPPPPPAQAPDDPYDEAPPPSTG